MYSYELKKPRTTLKIVMAVIITAIVMFFIMQYIYQKDLEDSKTKAQKLSVNVTEATENKENELNNTDIVENIMPSVVGISVLKPDGSSVFDINATEKWGLGTGIIISEKGYILTNQHLAQTKNSKITVTLENGESVSGKIIWVEENIDLAIVKIDVKDLVAVSLGESDEISIGEDVFAIGNPLGLEFQRSVTRGIISGLNRTLKLEEDNNVSFMEGLIQTDASINSGNSGGPLINSKGEVIGVNTIKISSAEGIGFAVPINIVKPILDKLNESDEFSEGTLGIFAYDKEVIPYMDSKTKLDKGIYVVSIEKNGPSSNTSLRVGDVITKIDGNEINKMIELRAYIYTKEPGDTVSLSVISGSKEKEVTVKLGKK